MEPTQHPNLDEALVRILSEPSTAAKIALAAADALDEHPHCTVTGFDIGYATQAGVTAVTRGLPAVVADEATAAACRAMPIPLDGERCGDYADRVRDIAEAL